MRNIFKDKLILTLTIVIVILFAAVLFLLFGGGQGVLVKNQPNKPSSFVQSEEAAKETQKLLDEAKKIAEKEEGKPGPATEIVSVKREKNGTTTEEKAIVIGFESSPISLETGEVLTKDGERVRTDMPSGEIGGPRVSDAINPSTLPESTVKLTMKTDSITPDVFKVKSGQAVSLAAINQTQTVDLLRFDSPLLSAVVIGLYKDQTMAISFNAPLVPGEYVFYSEFFRAQGAVGKMIVE